MVQMTPNGLYCEAGDFYIDPHRKVARAVITHAHSDHARPGMEHYLAQHHTAALMRKRLGARRTIQEVEYAEPVTINGVELSLHPAGHVAGSSQVRLEYRGEVWVVTGDYKRELDPVSTPFEVVPCHTLITECTFGLPVYRWPTITTTMQQIRAWWQQNAQHGEVSVIRGYSLGKAQRILAELYAISSQEPLPGPIYVSRAIAEMNSVLRSCGYSLPETHILPGTAVTRHELPSNALVMTSTLLHLRAGAPQQQAEVSGWLAVRRHHRPRSANFVVSDHADWPALMTTIQETGAERVLTMHGFTEPLARYLSEKGYTSAALERGSGRTALVDVNPFVPAPNRRHLRREKLCDTLDVPRWLFDLCVQHTGSVREARALIDTGTYQGRTSRPTSREVAQPELLVENLTITTVLYHVHRYRGTPSIELLTMAVWHDNELVPLAHVPCTIERDVLRAVLDFAADHTTVQVGPVRTLQPHFVFTITATGLSISPRKKSGLTLHDARIVAYHEGRDPRTADSLQRVHDVIKGAGI